MTLGEALAQFGEQVQLGFVPHDPPKFFRSFNTSDPEAFWLVDVHLLRQGEEICLKQDLSYPLLPDDQIRIGLLAC